MRVSAAGIVVCLRITPLWQATITHANKNERVYVSALCISCASLKSATDHLYALVADAA